MSTSAQSDSALFELIAPLALESELVDWFAEQFPEAVFLVSELRGHNLGDYRMSTEEQVRGTVPLLRLTVRVDSADALSIGPALDEAFPRARKRWWVVDLAAEGP